MMLRTFTLVIWALTLVGGAAAEAGMPFTVGKGGYPSTAVGSDRITHLVWVESGSADGDVVRYCRFVDTARRCSTRVLLPAPGDGGLGVLRSPQVFLPGDGRVVVSEARDAQGGRRAGVYARASTDGGATFGAPVRLAHSLRPSNAVFGPGESISGVDEQASFSNVPLAPAGPLPDAPPRLSLATGYASDADIALDAAAPVVAWSGASGDSGVIYFRRYIGGDASSASLHNDANWSPAAPVDSTLPASSDPNVDTLALAGGSGGLYLAHLDEGESGADALRVHAFRNGAFDEGTIITRPGRDVDWFALGQDPQGNVHAVWEAPGGFYWRTATPGGWGPERLITVSTFLRQPTIAPLSSDFGRVFYTTSNVPTGNVRGATSLDLACQAGDTRAGCRLPACERRRSCSPNKWKVNGTRIKLLIVRDRRTCVHQEITARLQVMQARRRLGPGRVLRVKFELARAGTKTDQGSPFAARFDVPQSLPGARHRVFARARVTVGNRTSTFSMSAPFTVCDFT